MTESIRQQDLQVLVAQELGDGQGHVGGLAALQGRLVRGGDHDDGALQALLAQGLLDELADLAAPFADQARRPRRRRSASLASIDSSTDLPTPEPAKTPRRWPRQQVVKTFIEPDAEVQALADPAAGVGGEAAARSG